MTTAPTALSATPFDSFFGTTHVLCDMGPAPNCLRVRTSAAGMLEHPSPDSDFELAFFNWKNGALYNQPFGAPFLNMSWDQAQTEEGRAQIFAATQIHERDLDAVIRWNKAAVAWHRENAHGGLRVLLSSCGNADHGQDPNVPRPHTVSGFHVPVDSLWQASAMCRSYIQTYGLGAGNWAGGAIVNDDGLPLARVSFNGRVFTPDIATSEAIISAASPSDFPQLDREDFFVLHRDLQASQAARAADRPRP